MRPAHGPPPFPPRAKPAKPKKAAEEDEQEEAWTLKQKVTVGAAAAVIGLVLLLMFPPSFGSGGGAGPPVLAKVSADQILRDFRTNQSGAARKYMGSFIHVTGEVEDVFKDKRPRVRFKTADRTKKDFVEAIFTHPSDLAKIEKGQTITVRGECEGYSKKVVEITLSKVVPTEKADSTPAAPAVNP